MPSVVVGYVETRQLVVGLSCMVVDYRATVEPLMDEALSNNGVSW